MKPMATKRRRSRAWDWIVGLTILSGLALFLRSIYYHAEPKDALTAARAAYDRGEWSRAADLARERLKTDGNDLPLCGCLPARRSGWAATAPEPRFTTGRLGAEALEPEDAFLLGLAASRLGDEQKALAVWSKAAQESRDHPELLLSLANLLARMQRLDESAALAQRLAAVPGWQAAGLLLLGTNRFSLDDHAGAAEALAHGLELDPEASKAPWTLGCIASFWRDACSHSAEPPRQTAGSNRCWRRRQRTGRYRGGLAGQPVGPPAEAARSFQGRACPVRNVSRRQPASSRARSLFGLRQVRHLPFRDQQGSRSDPPFAYLSPRRRAALRFLVPRRLWPIPTIPR